MNNAISRKTLLTLFLPAMIGCFGGKALAHSQSGSLGASASATDLYQVSCTNDGSGTPAKLWTAVRGNASGASLLVSVQNLQGGSATSSTDLVNGDSSYSTGSYRNGGTGPYKVLVDKNGTGVLNYTLEYHCVSDTGDHTGTDIVTLQNQ